LWVRFPPLALDNLAAVAFGKFLNYAVACHVLKSKGK
jgi:hypothetical protein